MFPGAMFLIGLATLSGLLFYLTSAKGAMVMSNFSASIPDPGQDGPKWLRVFWAIVTAVLTVAMLLAGGVTTMEYATLIFALPVTIIAYLVMASFHKVLGLTKQQVIDDVLERYEAHLTFLTVSSERDTRSVLTPSVLPSEEHSAVPADASDVQDLGDEGK